MPIASGAGGKPNEYFNSTNAALGPRHSLNYTNNQPARRVESLVIPEVNHHVVNKPTYTPKSRGSNEPYSERKSRIHPGRTRRCCSCPSSSRPELTFPTMPMSHHISRSSITGKGCCIFLLGLLALLVLAGLIAGIYFLVQAVNNSRQTRLDSYNRPGYRPGDLIWIVYGKTQPCTTDLITTKSIIPCASTTVRYEQIFRSSASTTFKYHASQIYTTIGAWLLIMITSHFNC